jgi:hypothetical protein
MTALTCQERERRGYVNPPPEYWKSVKKNTKIVVKLPKI